MSQHTSTSVKSRQDSSSPAVKICTVACRVPEDVRRDFHAACIYKGQTMNKALIEFIHKTIASSKRGAAAVLVLIAIAYGSTAYAQVHPLLKPLAKPSAGVNQPAAPTQMPPAQPTEVKPPVSQPPQPSVQPPVQPSVQPSVQPTVKPSVQPPVVPMPEPIKAQPVKDIVPTQASETMQIKVEQLELGKISRTVSSSELKKMETELVATEMRKPINVSFGADTVKLEVPVIAYLIKEKRVTPSPMAVPVASADSGYKFSDSDMRNLKIMYNALLEKANVNATTSERFREILKSMENYVRELDARKQAAMSND